ncbi:hypothetical protein CDL12_26111 [Handroanthus impetiginosus]|uniref:Retrotransposon gag domain-containing protein n=1 Tax=Handroanthus impetiginosus TaxID=429701 RepID=A0A2G9G7X1_9LAMI|nr:hypothetical protein CDL12_26111 [Handroanthus impetiginosus]
MHLYNRSKSLLGEELSAKVIELLGSIELTLLLGEFNKLIQTGSVQEHYEKFDDLIFGLKEEIKRFVLGSKPYTLLQVVAVAKCFESTVEALITKLNSYYRSPHSKTHQRTNPPPINFFLPPNPPNNTRRNTTQPIRRLLTAEEMKARREKNLCYNCHEVYMHRHRCKQGQLFVMMTKEEKEAHILGIGYDEECIVEVLSYNSTVSLNALNKHVCSETIKIKGILEGKEMNILIEVRAHIVLLMRA